MEKEKTKPKEKSNEEKFVDSVAEWKKDKSKEELLEIVETNPNAGKFTILDRMIARKALDELKIPYSRNFKAQGKEKPAEEKKETPEPEKVKEENSSKKSDKKK